MGAADEAERHAGAPWTAHFQGSSRLSPATLGICGRLLDAGTAALLVRSLLVSAALQTVASLAYRRCGAGWPLHVPLPERATQPCASRR